MIGLTVFQLVGMVVFVHTKQSPTFRFNMPSFFQPLTSTTTTTKNEQGETRGGSILVLSCLGFTLFYGIPLIACIIGMWICLLLELASILTSLLFDCQSVMVAFLFWIHVSCGKSIDCCKLFHRILSYCGTCNRTTIHNNCDMWRVHLCSWKWRKFLSSCLVGMSPN